METPLSQANVTLIREGTSQGHIPGRWPSQGFRPGQPNPEFMCFRLRRPFTYDHMTFFSLVSPFHRVSEVFHLHPSLWHIVGVRYSFVKWLNDQLQDSVLDYPPAFAIICSQPPSPCSQQEDKSLTFPALCLEFSSRRISLNVSYCLFLLFFFSFHSKQIASVCIPLSQIIPGQREKGEIS